MHGRRLCDTLVSLVSLEVHAVRLRQPDSMWATNIAGITEFHLEIDATIDVRNALPPPAPPSPASATAPRALRELSASTVG